MSEKNKEIKKVVAKTVADLVKDLKAGKSTKFSKGDFETLVHGILSDKSFKAKKVLFKAGEMIVEEKDIRGNMEHFLEKLLKHAGVKNEEERKAIVESYKFTAKDVQFVADAYEEAAYLYVEAGKNMRLFREKSLQLAIKKIARSGKYEGKQTFKKTVKDKEFEFKKNKK